VGRAVFINMSNPQRRLRTPTPPSPHLFRSRRLFGDYDHSLTERTTVSPHPASPFWSVDCSSVYWWPFNPRVKAGSPFYFLNSSIKSELILIIFSTQNAEEISHKPPPFSAHVHCGQMAEWVKMPLGMEIDLCPGDCVRWGPSYPQNGAQPPIFGPCLLWPNDWMDQDATWNGGCLVPGDIVLDEVQLPQKGHAPNFWPMSIIAKLSLISAAAELL